MEQSRFKSPIFWSAVVAQVLSIGQLSGLFAKYGIDAGYWGDLAAAVLQLFVIFGLLNNPTSKTEF